MISHLTHDIGWPVLLLGVLVVLGAWRPLLIWWRAERDLYLRARRINARGGVLDFTRKRVGQ